MTFRVWLRQHLPDDTPFWDLARDVFDDEYFNGKEFTPDLVIARTQNGTVR